MKQQNGLIAKPDVEAVRRRFEEWRKTRKRGTKIPEDLWAAAVSLANTHSLTEICQWLRVEYSHLKRRIEQNQAVMQSSSAGFVELNLGRGIGTPMKLCVSLLLRLCYGLFHDTTSSH